MSGGDPCTTNNRMELQAIIEALEFVQGNEYVLYTDSELIMKCATGIYKRKANKDLWDKYEKVLNCRKLNWVWVKAHNGNCMNEYVDRLCRQEAEFLKNKIK
jgi:ribonuclease HI